MDASVRPAVGVRNTIGFHQRIRRLRGSPVQRDLRAFDGDLGAITGLEVAIRALSSRDIEERWRDLRKEAVARGISQPLRASAFALVREAAHRALGLRPFDVQVVAGIALDAGHIVEMQTGEGKTLAAVCRPRYAPLGRRPHPDLQRLPGPA